MPSEEQRVRRGRVRRELEGPAGHGARAQGEALPLQGGQERQRPPGGQARSAGAQGPIRQAGMEFQGDSTCLGTVSG